MSYVFWTEVQFGGETGVLLVLCAKKAIVSLHSSLLFVDVTVCYEISAIL